MSKHKSPDSHLLLVEDIMSKILNIKNKLENVCFIREDRINNSVYNKMAIDS